MSTNTTNTQSLRRQAFIDGQLSVEEVIAFQEDQSAEERAQLEREMAFEQAFATHLNEAELPSCPPALWEDLQARILREPADADAAPASEPAASEDPQSPAPRPLWILQVVAAAAAITVAALLIGRNSSDQNPGYSVASELNDNLSEFVADAEIKGDVHAIRSALANTEFADVDVLGPEAEDHHPIEFLGMRHETVNGKPAVRLYLSCCNRPAAILLTSGDQAPPAIDQGNLPDKWYHAKKNVGRGHHLSIVSPHSVDAVLKLFS